MIWFYIFKTIALAVFRKKIAKEKTRKTKKETARSKPVGPKLISLPFSPTRARQPATRGLPLSLTYGAHAVSAFLALGTTPDGFLAAHVRDRRPGPRLDVRVPPSARHGGLFNAPPSTSMPPHEP